MLAENAENFRRVRRLVREWVWFALLGAVFADLGACLFFSVVIDKPRDTIFQHQDVKIDQKSH